MIAHNMHIRYKILFNPLLHTLTTADVGLVGYLSVGLLSFVLIIIVVTPIIFIIVCYIKRKKTRPVQTHVMATRPTAGATTGVTSDQDGASTTAPVPYLVHEPTHKDAHLSSEDAPPSYTSATPFSLVIEVSLIFKFCLGYDSWPMQ